VADEECVSFENALRELQISADQLKRLVSEGEIRAIRGDIPIVLMSGYVTPALAHRARDAGVLDVLAKPLVARDIARSLADALQQPS